MRIGLLSTAVLFSAAAAAGPGVAPASAADEPFYQGKVLRLVDAPGATGSYAIYTRILVRHLPRHIPGTPTIVVEPMEGGGGLKAQNYVFNAAPKDGSTIISPMPSVVTAPMLYPRSAHFDPTKFLWIGNVTQLQTAIGVWKASTPVRTLEQAKTTEVVLGSSGRTSELTLTPLLLNAVLGTKFRIINGYAGLGTNNTAIERGEIHGRSGGLTSWHPLKPDWFAGEPRIAFLAQLGMSRHPAIPDVPLVTDFARNDEERQIAKFVYGLAELSRPVAAPPGVPADRVAALRKAFWAMVTSPEAKADAEKLRIIVDPMNADETVAIFRDVLKTPKSIIDRSFAAMRK